MNKIIECKLCTSDIKLETEDVVCEICGTLQDIGDLNNMKETLAIFISELEDYVEKLTTYNFRDSTLPQIVDNAKAEAYRDCLGMMSNLSEKVGGDLPDVEPKTSSYIKKTRMCDMNRLKICDGCMDC